MTTRTSSAPKKADIQSHARDDLRNVYLMVYNTGTVDVGEVADKLGHNIRYTRELLGTLNHAGLIVNPDENDTGTWTYSVDFFQDRADNEVEAEGVIDAWLTEKLGPVTSTKATSTTATTPKRHAPLATPLGGDCLCGCGRPTRKLFAPGHDARFAGMIAREVVEIWAREGVTETQAVTDALAKLPSGALRDKAYAQAQKLWDRSLGHASTKQIEAAIVTGAKQAETDMERALRTGTIEPFYVYGRVKVGRRWFLARRDTDNVVNRNNTPIPDGADPINPLDVEYTGSVEGKPAATFEAFGVQP